MVGVAVREILMKAISLISYIMDLVEFHKRFFSINAIEKYCRSILPKTPTSVFDSETDTLSC